ncbi:hypothetical protein MIS46_05505 [Wielerella bovis]|uniref:hypothetical protein n=1 Tax=Wielerella bovis TaxID=2917790 RepID=UPI0020193E1F|nr:hypothetical protein [Wielerella bovis]ULJ63500.1 hypothetical protein MIS46_05505 [Wielerella bovis]
MMALLKWIVWEKALYSSVILHLEDEIEYILKGDYMQLETNSCVAMLDVILIL